MKGKDCVKCVCVCVWGGGGVTAVAKIQSVFAFLNICHIGKVLGEVKMNRTVTNQCCMFTLTATPIPGRRHCCI